MVELVNIKDLDLNTKIALLNGLGFSSDGIFVLDCFGNKVYDKYIDQPVKVENMLILSGSTIIIDDNPLSIASYFEEFPDAIQYF